MRSGPPPRTRSERRALYDDDFAQGLYRELLAEQAAIDAEYARTWRRPEPGACTICGLPSDYPECARCDDEENRARQDPRT